MINRYSYTLSVNGSITAMEIPGSGDTWRVSIGKAPGSSDLKLTGKVEKAVVSTSIYHIFVSQSAKVGWGLSNYFYGNTVDKRI